MALGGGMQDKNEVGGGMLYPYVPPAYNSGLCDGHLGFCIFEHNFITL